MSDEPEITEPEAPEFPYEWMPLAVGNIEIVNWDGHSYVDRTGRTYWSGQEPTAEDAADAVTTLRIPPPEVPQEVTRPRFIIALRKVLNITEGTVYAMISGLPAEQQEDVRDWFDHGVFFDRADPLLNAVATSQGITSEQLDAVFIHAANQT